MVKVRLRVMVIIMISVSGERQGSVGRSRSVKPGRVTQGHIKH